MPNRNRHSPPTISRIPYLREGMILPDLVVPMSEHRTFKYFREETLETAAAKYGWTLIDDSNRKTMFMDMVRRMDMSYVWRRNDKDNDD